MLNYVRPFYFRIWSLFQEVKTPCHHDAVLLHIIFVHMNYSFVISKLPKLTLTEMVHAWVAYIPIVAKPSTTNSW